MSFSRQRSSAHTVRRQTPRAIARIANLFETDCSKDNPLSIALADVVRMFLFHPFPTIIDGLHS